MIPDWQMNVLNKIQQGFKKGQLSMITTGRQTGKSSGAAFMRLWNDLHPTPVEQLVISEGSVYGSSYYCVEPVGGSWLQMETWCLDTMGENGSAWDKDKAQEPNARWYMNDRRFWFRDEKDRTMFVLKWR